MNLKSIFRGSLLSILLTFFALFIGSTFVYYNLLSEKTVSVIVFCAASFGVFIGSFGVVRTSERRLLLNALSVALIFTLIIIITSISINGKLVFHVRTLALIGSSLFSAFLGALLGK